MPKNLFPKYGKAAERMYVDEGVLQKDIARFFSVTEKTISEWAQKGDWEKKREKKRREKEDTAAIIKGLMRQHVDYLAMRAPGQVTPADLDMLAKYAATLARIENTLDPRAATLFVMKKLNDFLGKKDKDLQQKLAEVAQEFFELMERE